MGRIEKQIFYGSYGDLRKNIVLYDGLEKMIVNHIESDDGIIFIGVEKA